MQDPLDAADPVLLERFKAQPPPYHCVNTQGEQQALLAWLLCGITAAEVVAARVADVDTHAGALIIPGEPGQALPLDGPMLRLLAPGAAVSGDAPLFPRAAHEPMTLQDVQSLVTSSALDANLSNALEVLPETLRHAYIAFLSRHGLRFGDPRKAVGLIPSDALRALASLSRPGPSA